MTTKSEMFAADELYIIQSRQFRKAVHYAFQRSPFYRDLLESHGLQPSEIKNVDDCRLLPTTSRLDLEREGLERFLCVRPEEVADIIALPLREELRLLKLTESDLTRLAYNDQLSFRMAEVSEKDVAAICLPLGECSLPGLSAYLGLRRIGAAVLRVGGIHMPGWPQWLRQTCPTVLLGTAESLKQFTLQMAAMQKPLAQIHVKRLVCLGGTLRERDFSQNRLGEWLARQWGAEVISAYTRPEVEMMICECEAGQGMHVHPELAQVEVLDGTGEPMPDGELGELCITAFGVAGMPLLRFRTGEMTFMLRGQCECGRWTPRIGPILGPAGSRFELAGVKFVPSQILSWAWSEPEVAECCLVLTTAANGGDQATLWLGGAPQPLAESLRQAMHQQWGAAPQVQAVSAEAFAALGDRGLLRQFGYCLDQRQRA